MLIKLIAPICGLVFAIGSSYAVSGEAIYDTRVTKILLDDSRYGGCLVYIDNAPNNNGLQCNSSISAVSFDCLGTRADAPSKATAQNKLSAAQLALVTGNRIRLQVVDTGGQLNGYCYAPRIDNYAN